MNWRILLIFTLVISLFSAKIAMACESDQNHQHQDNLSSSSLHMNDSHNMNSGSNMEGMDMGKNAQSDGAGKEQAPNIKVLGTYGVINLLFIVIGVWNKWFRRKDGFHVASK